MHLPPEDLRSVITRLKRAHGHLDAVIRMLQEGADCEDALTQLAAVNKAISRGGYALVATGLQWCLADEDTGDVDVQRLEKLFLALA